MNSILRNNIIESSEIFCDVEQVVSDRIIDSSIRVKKSSGEFIFMKGSKAEFFYFIIEGRAKQHLYTLDGEERIIKLHRSKVLLGVNSFFSSRQRYTTYCSAIDDCYLLAFPRQVFIEQLKKSDRLMNNVLIFLTDAYDRLIVQYYLVQKSSAVCMTANYIIDLANSILGNTCNSSRQCYCKNIYKDVVIDLRPIAISAQEAGLTRETFTRNLRFLSDKGSIEVFRGQLKILDICALAAEAKVFE